MILQQVLDVLHLIGIPESQIVIRREGQLQIPCPLAKWFHSKKTDNNPSLSIGYSDSRPTLWKCFSCIPENEEVLLDFGLLKLKHVVPGMRIWDGDSWRKISQVVKKTSNEIFQFKLEKNRIPIRSTPDHKFFVMDNDVVVEKEASELQLGDELVYPSEFKNIDIANVCTDYIKNNWYYRRYNGTGKIPQLSSNVPLNEEFLKFIGWYIAEGSSTSNGRNCVFTLCIDEEDIADELLSIAWKLFKLSGSIHRNEEHNVINVIFSNVLLASLMKDLCGDGCSNKHIPFNWMNLPKNKLEILLGAILKGDGGHNRAYNNDSITTTSKCLAFQLWDVAVKLQLYPSFYPNFPKNKKPNYVICWGSSTPSGKAFNDRCILTGKFEKGTGARLGRYKNGFYCLKIVEKTVTKSFEDCRVVDITVDDSSRFFLNGIIVHNCHESGKLWQLIDSLGQLDGKPELVDLAGRLVSEDKPTLEATLAAATKDLIGWVRPPNKRYKIAIDPGAINRMLFAMDSPSCREYLLKREITTDLCKTFNLRYSVDKNRIVFPVLDKNNHLVGGVGRWLGDPVPNDIAKYKNFFGFEATSAIGGINFFNEKSERIILVEGYFCLIHGFKWCRELNVDIGCTFHGEISEEQAAIIGNLNKPVQCWYDNDETGNRGWEKMKPLLWGQVPSLKRAPLPEKIDVGSMTRNMFMDTYIETTRVRRPKVIGLYS